MIAVAAAALAACLVVPVSAMHAAAPLPPLADRPLAPVILDPGHGGDDFGAVVKGLQEKDIALTVTRKLRDRLQSHMPVRLTREEDTFVSLDRRVVDSVDWNGSVFVSIHLNKVRDKSLSGATIYSYGAETRRRWRPLSHPLVPPMPAPPGVNAKESSFLAAALVRAMHGDGYRVEKAKSDYYVLKNPAQPSVLIEIGYLSNPAEAAHLNDPAYQDKLADTLAKAIGAYAAGRSLRAETASIVPAAPRL